MGASAAQSISDWPAVDRRAIQPARLEHPPPDSRQQGHEDSDDTRDDPQFGRVHWINSDLLSIRPAPANPCMRRDHCSPTTAPLIEGSIASGMMMESGTKTAR